MLKEEFLQHYIKIRRDEGREYETAAFHIHVDSQEVLAEEITRRLLESGFTYDLFDPEWRFYGRNGDPNLPFDHYAPVQHMTFVSASVEEYRKRWKKAVEIVKDSNAQCYIEGELIVLDEDLPVKEFDYEAFEMVAPRAAQPASFAIYRSAIEPGVKRLLPAQISLRRLDPERNGRGDRFRRGEMHMTLRHDTHPLLLELLCNLGFSVPAIPKLVESADGGLERNPDGSLRKILDIPLTIQTTDMRQLMRVANLAVTIVERVGGVVDGSVKIEFATHFAVLNGVNYNDSIPPVLDRVIFREEFESLGYNKLGSIDADLAQLTRHARNRVRRAPHDDRIVKFEKIWSAFVQED